MSNLQIKGIDERLYQQLKQLAADENRSVSQQVLFLIRNHLARKRRTNELETAAQTMLALAGSWEDSRTAEQIIHDIKNARRSSRKFSNGLPCCFCSTPIRLYTASKGMIPWFVT